MLVNGSVGKESMVPDSVEVNDGVEGDDVLSDFEAEEEEDDHCLVIHLTKEERRWLHKPWIRVLIIKLIGRTIGYTYLVRKCVNLCPLLKSF